MATRLTKSELLVGLRYLLKSFEEEKSLFEASPVVQKQLGVELQTDRQVLMSNRTADLALRFKRLEPYLLQLAEHIFSQYYDRIHVMEIAQDWDRPSGVRISCLEESISNLRYIIDRLEEMGQQEYEDFILSRVRKHERKVTGLISRYIKQNYQWLIMIALGVIGLIVAVFLAD